MNFLLFAINFLAIEKLKTSLNTLAVKMFFKKMSFSIYVMSKMCIDLFLGKFFVFIKGRNYISKMKSDRTEMLYWLQQERRSERLDAIMITNPTTTTKTQTTHLAPVLNKIDLTAPVDVTIT